MAAGDEKAKFRCLDAARCAVAVAVTVLILVVVVYAVVTVLRPGNLSIQIIDGYVSVKNASSSSSSSSSPGNNLTMHLTIREINPSGRVRIYFTEVVGYFSGQINRSSPVEDFYLFQVPDIGLALQESADASVVNKDPIRNDSSVMLPEYFNQLFYDRVVPNAMLKLSGKRTVETYSGHNDTGETVVYYCPSIIIGGEEPDEPANLQCSENLPASASS